MKDINEELSLEMEKVLSEAMAFQEAVMKNQAAINSSLLAQWNSDYQSWYSRSLEIIRTLAPDRMSEFIGLYKPQSRELLKYTEDYTISDFFSYSTLGSMGGIGSYKYIFESRIITQVSILRSVIYRTKTILQDIKGLLQMDLFDNELEAARELLQNKYYRPAGILCGVVLEQRFKTLVDKHDVEIKSARPTLGILNLGLRESGVLDDTTYARLAALIKVRNLCAHDGEREPTEEEVDYLVTGTELAVKSLL